LVGVGVVVQVWWLVILNELSVTFVLNYLSEQI